MKQLKTKIPIFGGDLIIKQINNWDKINEEFGLDISPNMDAVVFSSLKDDYSFELFMWFVGKPSNPIICHECTHAVNTVFKYRGVKLDVDNDETQAYFNEWFFEQVENYFELNK